MCQPQFEKTIKLLTFSEGELIEIRSSLFRVHADQEGEPRRHKVKKKTGEVSKIGHRIKISDKFRRIDNH
jgi:hypothetical protein